MTKEVEISDWKSFFNEINHDFLEWETVIQIINDEAGVQVLSKGLPLNGFNVDEKRPGGKIELSIGNTSSNHHSHNIFDPLKVAFEPSMDGTAGTLDIEDASGTKTLITFIKPMPVLIEYSSSEAIQAG